MGIDIELAKFLFQVLTFLMTGGIGIYVYLSNKDKVTNDRIGKLEDDLDLKLDGHGERIATLESSAIKHRDLAELHEKINSVSGDMKTLSGEFSAVRNLLMMLNEYMVKGGK
jgi:hypothetical protein